MAPRTRPLTVALLAFTATCASPEASCGAASASCPGDVNEPTSLLQRPQKHHHKSLAPHTAAKPARSTSVLAGKSYYFIPVDRFVNPTNSTPCDTDNDWCGGTIAGITSQLDYIQGMGFDCIWITPVVKQYDGPVTASGTGCMGYWAYNLYEIDPHFGTPQDLKDLVAALHDRGMCIMYDFVANHMGPIHGESYVKKMYPFNETKYFHQLFRGNLTFDEYTAKSSDWPPPAQAMWSQSGAQCTQGEPCNCYACSVPIVGFGGPCTGEMVFNSTVCPPGALSPYCMPGDYACKGYNETITQEGWFYDLGDLNQSDPFVRDEELKWVSWFVKEYNIDVLRLDTAAFMPFDFLSDLQAAAGVPIIGEVTTTNLTFHAQFQSNPPGPGGHPVLDAVLNFPIYFSALAGFCGSFFPFSVFDLTFLGERIMEQLASPYTDLDTLGNFIDNHDVQRVASACHGDTSRIANALTFVMFLKGVPIVYYGTEVLFTSQDKTNQRTAMWGAGYNTSTPFYKFIKLLNHWRKETSVALADEQVYTTSNSSLLVISRGGEYGVWVYLNNLAMGSGTVEYPVAPPPAKPGYAWVHGLDEDEVVNITPAGTLLVSSTQPRVLVHIKAEEPEPAWVVCGTTGQYCCDPNQSDPRQYCRTGKLCGNCGTNPETGLLNHCECQ